MGRARGYSASHAATSRGASHFDAVLGARRGSASAQADRDAQENEQENQAREAALKKMIAELVLSSGSGVMIHRLATAYRRGEYRPGTPEYEELCKSLTPKKEVGFIALRDVAAHGDPEHWPGLTAPAVDALGAHLQATSDGGDAYEEEGSLPGDRVFRARTMTASIREYGNSLERYERLTPVLEGLAALLPHLPPQEYGTPAARPMAELLRDAPTEALAGPLQPLVQAFRQRIQDGKSSPGERVVLRQIIADQVLHGQVDEAFRPVADVL